MVGSTAIGVMLRSNSAGATIQWLARVGYQPSTPAQVPEGAVIRTVLLDLPPRTLGRGIILFHEHLSAAYSRTERQTTLPPPSNADLTPIIEDVRTAAAEGVVAIADGGHPDMGRNMDHLRSVSRATGVHVIASGGYYMQNTYPLEISRQSEQRIAEDLAREVLENRYGAFGEIGQSPDAEDFTPDERKVFRAVGRAHVLTGLPIFTHTPYGTGPRVPTEAGPRQLDLLESVGVPPQRVAIGHACCLDEPDAATMKRVARRGAFVGFDRVTAERILPDAVRVRMVLSLLDAGYADQLLLSSDLRRSFNRTTSVFVPKLRAAGVSEEVLQGILIDNPRRFLAFVPARVA
jgi:phosphotriesterase-related protein